MNDARMRELERCAAIGDEGARMRLLAARLRAGLDELHYELLGGQPHYGRGLDELRRTCERAPDGCLQPRFVLDGEEVVRPFTFKETLENTLWQYRNAATEIERMRLFNRWNDTCTAIVYKEGTSKLKIIPLSEHLLRLKTCGRQAVIPVRYDVEFEGVPELDRCDAPYNVRLPKSEIVMPHEGWLGTVEGASNLLEEYADVVYFELDRQYGRNTGMGFWAVNNPDKDHLQALFVDDLSFGSDACGNLNLGNLGARFVRVIQREITEELDYVEEER